MFWHIHDFGKLFCFFVTDPCKNYTVIILLCLIDENENARIQITVPLNTATNITVAISANNLFSNTEENAAISK